VEKSVIARLTGEEAPDIPLGAITINEAARRYGYSRRVLTGYAGRGLFPTTKVAGRHYVMPGDIEAYIESVHGKDGRSGKGDGRGESHGRSVLTEDQVLAIDAALDEEGATLRGVAAEFGISPGAVQSIKDGRSWGWLTGRGAAHEEG